MRVAPVVWNRVCSLRARPRPAPGLGGPDAPAKVPAPWAPGHGCAPALGVPMRLRPTRLLLLGAAAVAAATHGGWRGAVAGPRGARRSAIASMRPAGADACSGPHRAVLVRGMRPGASASAIRCAHLSAVLRTAGGPRDRTLRAAGPRGRRARRWSLCVGLFLPLVGYFCQTCRPLLTLALVCATTSMMSDHEVQMVKDNMSEFKQRWPTLVGVTLVFNIVVKPG